MVLLPPPPPRSMTTEDGTLSDRAYQWLSSLQQNAVQTAKSAAGEASVADYQGKAAGFLALTPTTVWNAAAYVALTDGATIAVDMATGFNFSVSIAGNRTLGNPSNAKTGQSGCIKVTASAANRTLSIGSNYKSTSDLIFPVTIDSGKTAYLFYFVDDASNIVVTAVVNNPT
ncbi:hypothetical protein [Hyphomicrobium methylovorum]|uniref:hypothetical protein n=1 Tax=Hyphomicrobium methylovorum TaxID=84 RepID=UPI0015E7708A|nr:hypothetical protein [Hyphomicrobium methylovorum]